MRRGQFSKSDDALIKKFMAQYGRNNAWKMAAKELHKSTRQIRDRYEHYLCPGLRMDKWTTEEDSLLIEKVKTLGTKWSLIKSFFQGRSTVNIKNRWKSLKYHNKDLENVVGPPPDQIILVEPIFENIDAQLLSILEAPVPAQDGSLTC